MNTETRNKTANDYAERVCNGQFPIEYSREQVVNHTATDFIAGWDACLEQVLKDDRNEFIEMADRIINSHRKSKEKIFTKEDARILLNNFQEYASEHEIDPPYSFSTLVNMWIDAYIALNIQNGGEAAEGSVGQNFNTNGSAAEQRDGAAIATNALLGGPKAEQLSCGCTPMQRTMITFTDDGDYCGGCGKLIPTT